MRVFFLWLCIAESLRVQFFLIIILSSLWRYSVKIFMYYSAIEQKCVSTVLSKMNYQIYANFHFLVYWKKWLNSVTEAQISDFTDKRLFYEKKFKFGDEVQFRLFYRKFRDRQNSAVFPRLYASTICGADEQIIFTISKFY